MIEKIFIVVCLIWLTVVVFFDDIFFIKWRKKQNLNIASKKEEKISVPEPVAKFEYDIKKEEKACVPVNAKPKAKQHCGRARKHSKKRGQKQAAEETLFLPVFTREGLELSKKLAAIEKHSIENHLEMTDCSAGCLAEMYRDVCLSGRFVGPGVTVSKAAYEFLYAEARKFWASHDVYDQEDDQEDDQLPL